MNILDISTTSRKEMVDITDKINRLVSLSGLKNGHCVVFVPHTTAGITINENADPSVRSDILTALSKAVPDNLPYRHGEGNSPAHVKASIMGPSVTVMIEEGKLKLGTWQSIYFCEFDGPRSRKVYLSFLA
ncbi:MAG: secondary thiamine-phosphate synthase enzyme YjbQ [Acidobacteriota bacterium]